MTVNGVQRSVYGESRVETLRKMREAASKAERGELQGDQRTTVAAFLVEWLDGPARRKLRPSTFAAYEHYVRAHLVPALGRNKLHSLQPHHIDGMLASKAASLSPRTLQQIRAILRSALSWGERNGRVGRNVAKLSEAPRISRPNIEPWTPQEARELVGLVYDDPTHWLGPLYVLALDTGLRQGELLGLRWEDVDFENGTLRVVQTREALRGRPAFGEPSRVLKNASFDMA